MEEMETILKILGLACLTNIIVFAEPVSRLKAWMGITLLSQNPLRSYLARLLGCCLCLGTFVGCIGMMSVLTGPIVAVLAEVISRKLTTIKIN